MGNTLFESMTRFRVTTTGAIIRCWRQEDGYSAEIVENTRREIDEVLQAANITKPTAAGAEMLLEIDRMNAVEILDGSGNGLVVYKDWP